MSESQSKWFQDEREILDEAIDARHTLEGLCHALSVAKDLHDVRLAGMMGVLDLSTETSVEWPGLDRSSA